jgi:ABC-type phosphate transport system substrate-binding protein
MLKSFIWRWISVTTLAVFLTVGRSLPAQSSGSSSFIVVVHSDNPTTSVSKAKLEEIFLKRVTRWKSDAIIAPIDQVRSSRVRELFSKAVHGRSTSAIEAYWQQQVFSGKDVPPATKASDAEVLAYVRSHPNAVGYVSVGTTLGENVKAVSITE